MKYRFPAILALCAAFSSANAANFWLPFVAATTGELYVIPSDDLSASPTLVGKFTSLLTEASQTTLNKSGAVTAYAASAVIYLAEGSGGKTHVYGLNLGEATPTPVQLSSFSLESPAAICSLLPVNMATNLLEPSTAFVLLHTNPKGSASCDKSGDVYEVVHYTDASTKAPTVVDITIKPFDGSSALPGIVTPIYRTSGVLAGIVLVNAAGDLVFYAGDAFTGPTTLTTGLTSMTPVYFGSPQAPSVAPDAGFFVLSTGTKQALWRVSAAGKADNVYSFQGAIGSFATDSSNTHLFYFDNVTVAESGGTGETTQHLYQESLSGGTPLHLYTAPPVLSNSAMIGQLGLTLIGSDGTVVVMKSVQLPKPTTFESSVVTVPVGKASSPTTIAGPFAGVDSLEVMTCAQTFGQTEEDVLMNITEPLKSGDNSYSSEATTVGGDIIQEKLANSVWVSAVAEGLDAGPQCPSNAGLIAQVRGITATDGSYGGGGLVAFNLHGDIVPPLPAVTPLKTSKGKDYVVASGDSVGGSAIFSSSGSIWAGYVGAGALPLPPGPAGLAIDFSTDLVAVFDVSGSKIEPL